MWCGAVRIRKQQAKSYWIEMSEDGFRVELTEFEEANFGKDGATEERP